MINETILNQAKAVFSLSSKYDLEMVKSRSVGGNALYNLETLVRHMTITPGMNVLDLACGKAISSVFIAKEFGARVFAVDSEYGADNNQAFIEENGLTGNVIPMQLDARQLPFAKEYFDCIIVTNSFTYFGTDDKFLPYILKFLKPGGQIGVADICFRSEIHTLADVPQLLKTDFSTYWYQIHALNWWINKWEKPALVTIQASGEVTGTEYEIMRNIYLEFIKETPQEPFGKALSRDTENFLSFFYLVGQRTNKKVNEEHAA
ncbi:MAG TPA: class I SAM-dependent methyltransferase [Segetibacter sp.]|jgi:ubiquinone/menaquinone biosynthesis C-methylase UbiE